MPPTHLKANDLLRYKVNVTGCITVKDISHFTGIPERTIYNWMADTSTVPPEVLTDLAIATDDVDYINVFVQGTKWELTFRQSDGKRLHPLIEALDVAESLGEMIASLKEALKDKRISPIERQDIRSRINKLRKEIDDVEQSIGE